MDHLTLKLSKLAKTEENLREIYSSEFQYFSAKPGGRSFKKCENKNKLFKLKLKLPKVKFLKGLGSLKKKKKKEDAGCNNSSKSTLGHTRPRYQAPECARYYFGDAGFACSCHFVTSSPDYKIYDEDVQFMYYNNAFFC